VRLASVLAIVLCCAAPAQADDALAARVDALAAEALQRPVAGLSVAVGRGGRVLLAKGYGLATFLVHGSTVRRFLVNGARARANAVYTDGLFMDAMMRVP
jgi:hypothetical protein